jgi:protein phosphatase
MGGHRAGEVASRLAVEAVRAFVAESATSRELTWPFGLDASLSLELNRLVTAVRLANRRVFEEGAQHAELSGMGTTVAAVLVSGDRVAWVGVGDSRIYRWRQPVLEQLTSDDTWVASVFGAQGAERVGPSHPFRHVLTSVLGMHVELKPSGREEPLRPGDTLVLCTDGVHGLLDRSALADLLSSVEDPAAQASALVDAALARGTSDNATAVVLRAA